MNVPEMLAWLVDERQIEPHIPLFDKSERKNGTFSRDDFAYDPENALYACPAGKQLHKRRRRMSKRWAAMPPSKAVSYRAAKLDCETCPLKPRCCPHEPMRKIPRSIHEAAREETRAIAKTEAYVAETHQIAVSYVYAGLAHPPGRAGRDQAISEAYLDGAAPIVRQ